MTELSVGRAEAHRYSLSSLNWIDFLAAPGREPPPSAVVRLEEVFDAAVSAGFSLVGVDLESARCACAEDTSHAAIAAELTTRGLTCSDVGILFLGLPGTEDDAQKLAALANDLKAPTCLTTFAGPLTDESIGQLRRSAACMQEAGARLALEYMPFGPLSSLAEAGLVCAEIGWDRCGLLLDSYHVCRAGPVREQMSGLSPEQIAFVQLADGDVPLVQRPEVDARRYRLPAGFGGLAISEFVSQLHGLGWAGTISPEVLAEDFLTITPRLGAALLLASARLVWEATLPNTGRSSSTAAVRGNRAASRSNRMCG